MPCQRVNCAQCLTVMVLKNQTHRVKQFLANLDKSHPFDPYVVVPFTSLPRFIRYANNEDKDIQQVEEYLLLNPNEPHLSFDELSPALMDPNQQWEYQVRPFYTIIFQCENVDSRLITTIITSDCFNPLEIHHEIWRVYVHSVGDWIREDNLRTVLKPVSLLSTLAASTHHNQLSRIINKRNVNDSFPSTIEWPYYRVTETNMRPSIG